MSEEKSPHRWVDIHVNPVQRYLDKPHSHCMAACYAPPARLGCAATTSLCAHQTRTNPLGATSDFCCALLYPACLPLDCTCLPPCPALQCGFIAAAPEPLLYTALQPFFVPQSRGSPCYCQQPFVVKPFQGASGASSSNSQAEAVTNTGVAKSLAEAMSQAFGGECAEHANLGFTRAALAAVCSLTTVLPSSLSLKFNNGCCSSMR